MQRFTSSLAILAASALALSACGSGSEGSPGSTTPGEAATSVSLWDGNAHYSDGTSPYEKLWAACEKETGIKVNRTVDPDVNEKFTRAASTGDLPDLIWFDNPTVKQFAETGSLVANSKSGLNTDSMAPNIMASAVLDGETYGASVGANTLGLFYNKDLLQAAGIEPPTTWSELEAAAQKLTDTSKSQYGIAFSARPDNEGTFQFLPFFWGAGAELTALDSPQAVEALEYYSGMVSAGYASSESVSFNQQEVRDQFMAGNAAMMVNGTWQLNTLDESGINYAVVPIPGKDGGNAPSPLGGEFIEIVNSGDDSRIAAAAKVAQCIVDPDNLIIWLEGQTTISPYDDQAKKQAADDARLVPWVDAVSSARSRTADLGSRFPAVGQNLGTALESTVTGQSGVEEALKAAAERSGK